VIPNRLLDRLFIKKPRLRRFVTRLLYGDDDCRIELCGNPLIVNTLSENGYYRAWRTAQRNSLYRDELPVLLNMAALSTRSDGFVDIGANIGVYSTIMARLARLREIPYPIYAFEVDPRTFSRLKINAVEYGFQAIQAGICDEECEMSFVRGAVSHVTTSLKQTSTYSIQGDTFVAKCAPLSSFDIAGDSLIIKIDVEGQELSVLRGCESLLEQQRVLAIYVDGFVDDRVPQLLKNRGFVFRDGRSLHIVGAPPFSLLAIRDESCN
jgi:FkbM family methyltransferase